MFALNTQVTRNFSINANYQLQYAKDLPGTPTDPYDFMLDYGRSSLDRRNNFSLFGNITAPLAIRIAPFVTLSSGAPYDVLAGQDLFGDTYTNVRAAFAAAGAACGGDVKCTPFGNFSTALSATNFSNLVPRNYLTQPGLVSLNAHVYRIFGFGPEAGRAIPTQLLTAGVVPAVVVPPVVAAAAAASAAVVAAAAAPVAAAVCAWVAAADAAAAVETPSTVST